MSTIAQLLEKQGPASKVQTITAEATVIGAAKTLRSQGIGCMLVVNEEGKLIGVVSERDIVGKVVAEAGDTNQVTIGQIMTSKVISATDSMTVVEAEKIMAENRIRHLPVIKGGKPVGMISLRDVLADSLARTQQVARQQKSMLKGLETQYPGITNIEKDASGRIVI